MANSRTLLILLVGLGSTAACSKDKEADKQAPAAAKAADEAPAVFSGELNAAAINAAKGIVKPFDQWTSGFAQLKGKMGEPTLVEGNNYYWGVMDGDSCTYIYVSKDNEADFFKDKPDPQDMIGTVADAMTTQKGGDGDFAACAKAAGIKAESLEDPNAPAPPEDGIASIVDLRAGVAGAKSKWLGKVVTVEGVLLSVSTSSASGSDETTTIVSLASEVGAADHVSCTLLDATQVEGLKQGAPLKVSGTVSDSFGGALESCSRITE